MRLAALSEAASPEKFCRTFAELAGRVRPEPYRAGLLPAATCELLLTAPYPAARESWLVWDGSRPIGRVAANVSAARQGVGYFGLLELDLDADRAAAARLLLEGARRWLEDRGVQQMLGPVALNTWFPYRLRLPDDDPKIFAWEPVNPPEYVAALEGAGLELAMRYDSTAFGDLPAVAATFAPAHERALAAGFRFRELDRDSLESELATLHALSHAAFADNYLFEPIPLDLFAQAYVGVADKGEDSFFWFVLDPEGEAVGFLYAFVDATYAAAGESAVVLKSAGVLPRARGAGLSNALVYRAIEAGHRLGAGYAISALVRAGIQSSSYARKGEFLWRHDYGLWQMPLAAGLS